MQPCSPTPSGTPVPPDPSRSKPALRRQILTAVRSLTLQARALASSAVSSAVTRLDQYRAAGAILVYFADDREPDLSELIAAALSQGKTVAAPRIDWDQSRMIPSRIASLDHDTVPTRHGLREPAPHCAPVPLEEISLVLVPGVAFDPSGNRLGRGGGFYDRFLAHGGLRAFRVGVAFDVQIVPDVPSLPHDAAMDAVVTESRLILPPRPGDAGRG